MSSIELPSYSNLSAQQMASKIGLNVKYILPIVQSFTNESTKILEHLSLAISKRDYEEIERRSHSIKGSAGNLKFVKMYELAKEMELSAGEKKEDYPYEEACECLKKAIKSISFNNSSLTTL